MIVKEFTREDYEAVVAMQGNSQAQILDMQNGIVQLVKVLQDQNKPAVNADVSKEDNPDGTEGSEKPAGTKKK